MPDKIHLTVATIVPRQGQFLMVRELDCGREVLNQPAGHVEPGETLQEAALRETLEETGWQIELRALLGFSHYRALSNGKTYYRVSFVAEPIARSEHAVIDEDILGCQWLSYDELRQCRNLRSPMVLSDINKFIKKIMYPLSFISNFSEKPL